MALVDRPFFDWALSDLETQVAAASCRGGGWTCDHQAKEIARRKGQPFGAWSMSALTKQAGSCRSGWTCDQVIMEIGRRRLAPGARPALRLPAIRPVLQVAPSLTGSAVDLSGLRSFSRGGLPATVSVRTSLPDPRFAARGVALPRGSVGAARAARMGRPVCVGN